MAIFNDFFFEAKAFLRHRLKANGPHGVHSPLVFDLITRVLPEKKMDQRIEGIESIRRNWRSDRRTIHINDLGAGSRINNQPERSIHEVARYALQPESNARALFRLVQHFQPVKILEIGTSLGITTAYLALASPQAEIYTIEGSPEVASLASETFRQLDITNISLVQGSFENELKEVLRKMGRLDFALIDGNHQYQPTMEYYRAASEYCHQDSVLVFDDIHWSSQMQQAWDEICARPEVSLSLDFFDFGLIFFKANRQKEHFLLKKPW